MFKTIVLLIVIASSLLSVSSMNPSIPTGAGVMNPPPKMDICDYGEWKYVPPEYKYSDCCIDNYLKSECDALSWNWHISYSICCKMSEK